MLTRRVAGPEPVLGVTTIHGRFDVAIHAEPGCSSMVSCTSSAGDRGVSVPPDDTPPNETNDTSVRAGGPFWLTPNDAFVTLMDEDRACPQPFGSIA